jgi:FSR family fosmidomycin resistance protein-like MFS transporter
VSEPSSASSSLAGLAVPHPNQAATVAGVPPVVARMGVAHFVVDWFSNTLAPLMPLLVTRLQLTLAGAGVLGMILTLASSVAQVLFGDLADRGRARLMLVGGAVLSVAGLSLLTLCQTWTQLVIVLIVGGLGVAAFHPAGAMLAHRFGRERPGYAMAVYVTSGTLGFAVGPLAVALVAEGVGPEWVPALAIPGLATVAIALRRLPDLGPPSAAPRGDRFGFRALRPYAKPLTLLYFLVVIRGVVSSALGTFLPVLISRRGGSVTLAAAAISVYFLAGGLGGFFGGAMSDRVGHRRVILLSMAVPIPFLMAAPLGPPAVTLSCLTIAGFFMQATLPVNVSFGQLLAPVSPATVASLLMGFAWGAGALFVPGIGALADRWGLDATMVALGTLPIAGVALAWPLPRRIDDASVA